MDPLKVKITISLAAQDRLPTGTYLHRLHIIPQVQCPFCDLHPESSPHIFLSCDFAKRVWAPIVTGLNLPTWPTSIRYMLEAWRSICIRGASCKIWDIRVQAIV